jgi:hypothetical protein
MVNRAFLENGVEERNGKDAALGRRLEKLRRDFGPTFLTASKTRKRSKSCSTLMAPLAGKAGRQMEIIDEMSTTGTTGIKTVFVTLPGSSGCPR